MHFFPPIEIKVYTWYILYISFRKNKGPKRDHFFHFSLHSQPAGRRSIAWEGLRTVSARLAIFLTKKLKGFSTVRVRLAHGWLGHSTCKTSPFVAWNPFKNENLNFCENLQIWLEILNKKKLKFWLQTTTWNRLLLKPFLKNHIPIRNFFFVGEHSNLSRILNP